MLPLPEAGCPGGVWGQPRAVLQASPEEWSLGQAFSQSLEAGKAS